MILTASPTFSQLLARGESFTPLFSSAPSPSVSFTASSAFTALRSSTGAVFCAANNRPSRFVEESSEEERVDAEKLEEPEAVKYYKLRSIHSVFPFLEDKLPHLDHLLEYSIPYPVHVEVMIRILRYSVKDPSCLHLLRVMLNQKRGEKGRLQLPFSDIDHVEGGASYAMENALSGGFTAVMELALSEKLTNERPSNLHHVAEKNKRSAPSRYG